MAEQRKRLVEAKAEPQEGEMIPAVERQGEEPQVVAKLVITTYSNGSINVDVPEDSEKLEPMQIEAITRAVYEQLHDQRIAQMALDMFKSRLG